jgi:hypothetical protein
MKKRTYIVRRYNAYEWINTEDAYFKLFLLIKYLFKGWQVFGFNINTVIFFKRHFNIVLPSRYGKNCFIERFVPGTDHITYYNPY